MDIDERPYERDDIITVRTLIRADLPRIIRIDQAYSGRNRARYLEGKLQRALAADIHISLGAEIDGMLVGAILGSVHYGEFGLADPIAVLDTILVDPHRARQGVGRAMLDQLVKNLQALRIERIRTEVAWNEHDLVKFLGGSGFEPVPRLVLERTI